MNPGSQWIVEFGVRENQAREQSWQEKTRLEEAESPLVAAPPFARRCLGMLGHFLLVAGGWLNRQAGEVYRADGGTGALGERRAW